MTVEIISRSISTKVWEQAGIQLATPGSAVRLASVARHVTDCATRSGISLLIKGSEVFINNEKVNKQGLLDTPRTVRFSEKNLASYSSNQQT